MNNATATIIGALILGLAIAAATWSRARSTRAARGWATSIPRSPRWPRTRKPWRGPPPRHRLAAGAPDPNRQYDVKVGRAPVRGPEDAKVTIVEFSDFQCPFCAKVGPTLKKIEEEYGDREVRIAFKQLPLDFHAKAVPASKAALAAGKQGKFWEMHDLIFANQKELGPRAVSRLGQRARSRRGAVQEGHGLRGHPEMDRLGQAGGGPDGRDRHPQLFRQRLLSLRGPALRGLQGRDRQAAGRQLVLE